MRTRSGTWTPTTQFGMASVADPAEFTSRDLRTLLGCQEYPEGTFALKIEAELLMRRAKGEGDA